MLTEPSVKNANIPDARKTLKRQGYVLPMGPLASDVNLKAAPKWQYREDDVLHTEQRKSYVRLIFVINKRYWAACARSIMIKRRKQQQVVEWRICPRSVSQYRMLLLHLRSTNHRILVAYPSFKICQPMLSETFCKEPIWNRLLEHEVVLMGSNIAIDRLYPGRLVNYFEEPELAIMISALLRLPSPAC